MSKFSNALGVWELKIGGVDLEFKPTFKHARKFRKVMTNDKCKNNNELRFDLFVEFTKNFILEFYPPSKGENVKSYEEDVLEYVEANVMPLFEEFLVSFKWETREGMGKNKDEIVSQAKKEMAGV